MTTSTEADVHLLNHVELFHRPGERDLAVRLFETMGCTVADVTKAFGSSSTYLCVYPGPIERDPLNNAVYISELREEDGLLHHLPAELADRVTAQPPFAYPLPALGREVMQGFVHTDLVGAGFPFGELIELQAQRPICE